MSDDSSLIYGEPQNEGCRTEQDSCIVGKKILIRARKIPKVKKKSGSTHRKQWTKADDAKCWIERPIRLRNRQR